MKKIMTLLMALCLTATMSAFAHDAKKEVTVSGIITDPMCAKSGKKESMENGDCAKRCSSKDGKLALVNSKDGSIWAIENVDAVKGHEGKYVKVVGHANEEAKSFHVTSIAMDATAGKSDMKHDMHNEKEMKKEDKKPAKAETKKT
jgi:hypothetical protein